MLVCVFRAAIPVEMSLEKRAILKPSEDPFYKPDPGYESNPVGTILRTRILNNQVGILIFAAKVQKTIQLLVRSEDTHGNANAIVTTIFVPYNADPTKLLSFQVAEDSASFDCSPSYAFQVGASLDTVTTSQLEQAFMYAPLEKGWYVVAPDYEGPTSSFGVGGQAGKATLNSVRAALASGNLTGISPNAKVSYWGYSGGSLATGWAALLQPTYAPELQKNSVGFAYGGILASVASTAKTNMGGLFAGFVVAAINGLSTQYPALDAAIQQQTRPEKLAEFRLAKHMCTIEELPFYAFRSWNYYFAAGSLVLNLPAVVDCTNDNDMVLSKLVPQTPLFFYNSRFDEILDSTVADKLYSRLCAAGVTIDYRQDILGGHLTQYVLGGGSAWTWIQARMAGTPLASGCRKTTSLTNILSPGGLSGFSSTVIGILLALVGKPLGPDIVF